MSEHFSSTAARIRALKTTIVSLLESDRDKGIPTDKIEQNRDLLVEAYQKLVNDAATKFLKESYVGSEESVRLIEEVYSDWRAIDRAFDETLSLAYQGSVPRQNLLLDDIHTELKHRVGDPIASLYTRLHSTWVDHLDSHPWDAHLRNDLKHADTDQLDKTLHSLVHGDNFDVEDAMERLTGPLRYAFSQYLEHENDPTGLLEESLWMRPEIIVINDYWQYHPQTRIIDLLSTTGRRKCSGAFAKVQGFFAGDETGTDRATPQRIANEVQKVYGEEKDTYLRCLMLHPNQEIRRYAVSNIDLAGFWKVATPEAVPLATILSMLEKVVGSNRYDENFQKVFFHAVHRRLLSATSRSEVLYARGIVRIFSQLPFVVEDRYFEKLMTIVDYLAAKERQYDIRDGILSGYVDELLGMNKKTRTRENDTPDFANIPAVVLRKLARDGHFWFDLAMHPLFKIAKETIPHINSEDRALRVANNHLVNQDVLREVGKKRGLFHSLSAKLALLSNPRTPPSVSLNYVSDLNRTDQERLLRRNTVHPEIRQRVLERMRT